MGHFFTDEEIDRIRQASDNHLLDVIRDFQDMEEEKGYNYRGICPVCGKRTFNYESKKGFFGCFNKCNVGGKDAVSYLMKVQNKTYVDALQYLADKFCVILKEKPTVLPKPLPKSGAKELKGEVRDSFCTRMLTDSGLTYDDVTATVYDKKKNSTITSAHTFTKGTVNSRGDIDLDGDDAIIKYYDLDGFPVTYELKDHRGNPTGKRREYFRVRWQHPDAHLDKEGKPFKYRSPKGSGTPIYIPEKIRRAFRSKEHIEYLFIQEGEKKAEKACKHGLNSIAISGIHNIALHGSLPEDMVRIIQECTVRSVVLLMDSDWNDLSTNIRINDSVDKRPRAFFYAAKNFKDYMGALRQRNIDVEIYFGHVNKNDQQEKGIDDLLAGSLSGHEEDIVKDFQWLINDKSLTGRFMQLFKISSYTDHKLSTIWGLNSVQNFAQIHKDALMKLPEFRFGSQRFKFNEEGKLENTQALEPDEQFWEAVQKSRANGDPYVQYEFRYVPSRRFLQNRGFGRLSRLNQDWLFIKVEHPFVRVIHPSEARDFLFDFAEANCNESVNEMLSKGVTQYVGPDKLSLLKFITPDFLVPNANEQLFFFEQNCWRVTQDTVKVVGYESIRECVWADQRIKFMPNYLGKPLISFSGNEENLKYILSSEGKKCDFLQFLINTSNFTWRKKPEEVDEAEQLENRKHLLSKLCAIGYMTLSYKDESVTRAVIGMDGKQSEVGDSNGRTGKSLIGVLMQNILRTTVLNGKVKDLLQDQFVWTGVDERTRLVFIDDVKVNFDFELLFPNLTGSWTVNYKGGGRITLPYTSSPKIYIATNHAIRGDSSSFTDRQWLLGFSDFYSDTHKPIDDFGCNFFSQWDFDQWNLCWNLVANCVQLYLRYGVVQAPQERLVERRLRQEISEPFIAWADEYFSNEVNLNRRIPRKKMYDDCMEYDMNMRKANPSTIFKRRLIKYCQFRGLLFNPQRYDPSTGQPSFFDKNGLPIIDDKSGGVEYFTIGNSEYYNSTEYFRLRDAMLEDDKRLSF